MAGPGRAGHPARDRDRPGSGQQFPELPGREDADATVGSKGKEVVISSHDTISLARNSSGKHQIIVGIPADTPHVTVGFHEVA